MSLPESITDSTRFVTSESRREYLLRTGRATPHFLQGVYPFVGRDIFATVLLHEELTYVVPPGSSAGIAYVRAGNSSDDLIYIVVFAADKPLRYFPLGPKADSHVGLAIVEPHPAGTEFSVHIGAPRGTAGAIILDIGLIVIAEGEPS